MRLQIIKPDGSTIPGADSINATLKMAPEGSKIILDPKTYYENVIIAKSVQIVGSGIGIGSGTFGSGMGQTKTVVDGSHAIGHKSDFRSVFTIGMIEPGTILPDIKVILSGMTIQGGLGMMRPDTLDTEGGGICNFCDLTVRDCIISGNRAAVGGGISAGGSTKVIHSTISNNAVTRNGGGFSTWENGEMEIMNCTITQNIAGEDGGGIFSMARMKVEDGSISGNRAGINGGGIANFHKLVLAGKCQVSNNQATKGLGGGVYSSTISVEFNGMNVGVKNNKAHLPLIFLPPGPTWYSGWGVNVLSGAPDTIGGFNPATQVTGNTHI